MVIFLSTQKLKVIGISLFQVLGEYITEFKLGSESATVLQGKRVDFEIFNILGHNFLLQWF